MTKLITMYITEGHCSIAVTNGITREVSAVSITDVIGSMHPDDHGPVKALCSAILEAIPLGAKEISGE